MVFLNILFLILMLIGAAALCFGVFCLVLDYSMEKPKEWMYKFGIRFLIIGSGSIIFSLIGYFLTALIEI